MCGSRRIKLPRYDYECGGCGKVFELRQSFDAEPYGDCPSCGGASRRKFHAVPIIYKGSGFYTTDYKHSNYSSSDKSEKAKETEKEKESTEAGSSNGTSKSEKKGHGAKEKSDTAKAAAGSSGDS